MKKIVAAILLLVCVVGCGPNYPQFRNTKPGFVFEAYERCAPKTDIQRPDFREKHSAVWVHPCSPLGIRKADDFEEPSNYDVLKREKSYQFQVEEMEYSKAIWNITGSKNFKLFYDFAKKHDKEIVTVDSNVRWGQSNGFRWTCLSCHSSTNQSYYSKYFPNERGRAELTGLSDLLSPCEKCSAK